MAGRSCAAYKAGKAPPNVAYLTSGQEGFSHLFQIETVNASAPLPNYRLATQPYA
jgi:hypothetical protein